MMRSFQLLKNCLLVLCCISMPLATVSWAQNGGQSDIAKRLDASASVIQQLTGSDNGIPNTIMSSASCIAVVPNLVKLAFMFGGEHGKGVASCRTANGWSAPVPITITGGSWGLQLGVEGIDLVMLTMHRQGMEDLLAAKFKIGAGASAAAGPVGRSGSADTSWKMNTEILTYSRSKGVFAGVNLSGASVTQDKDETHILYGKMIPFDVILAGKVRPPSQAETFMAAVRRFAVQSRQTNGELLLPDRALATAVSAGY
jgi:SH3 domain-containing YSC84-like protein 1